MPTVLPGLVSCASGTFVVAADTAASVCGTDFGPAVSFAKPKSRIFACPRLVTKMFAGLISRCTMPFAWAASRASGTCTPKSRTASMSRGSPLNQMLERLPFQQLHGDEVLTARFVDLVNRANVRVIQRGCSKRFRLKSFTCSRIILHFYRQELQRDMPVQSKVFGFVHHTHAAATELLQDAIVRNDLADHG